VELSSEVRALIKQSKAAKATYVSLRQDKAMLYDEESFKMEEKHEDHRNSASSQGHKYFIKEIPQGFLL